MAHHRSFASRSPSNGHAASALDNVAKAAHERKHTPGCEHDHRLLHENGTSHSHSMLGHTDSHEDMHSLEGAEKVLEALKGSGSRGSYITLVGLGTNVVLTTAKGVAGWYFHSASLLADAGHSLSDLLGDFVTLFCWNISRRASTDQYPYGLAKFETLGTTTISLLLIGGAVGIGLHSCNSLMSALSHTLVTLPPGLPRDVLQQVISLPVLPHVGHGHALPVDPSAAWFAAVSVVIKEWLYRITKAVAEEERSPVLFANAIHHRSDAYSSGVALFAILGSWLFPIVPLDPIGGLLVSFVILRQGIALLMGAWGDLTDAGVSERTLKKLRDILTPLITRMDDPLKMCQDDRAPLLAVDHLRARRAGSMVFVDLTAVVPAAATVTQISQTEHLIIATMKKARKEIAEVRVRFEPVSVR